MAHGTYLTTFDLLAKILFLSYGVWYAFGFVYLMKKRDRSKFIEFSCLESVFFYSLHANFCRNKI